MSTPQHPSTLKAKQPNAESLFWETHHVAIICFLLLVLSSIYADASQGGVPSAGQLVTAPNLPYKFTIPAGWELRTNDLGYVAVPPQRDRWVMVVPHNSTMDEMFKLSADGFVYKRMIVLHLVGTAQRINSQRLAVNLAGEVDGKPAQARLLTLFSPTGGGAMVLSGGHSTDMAAFSEMADAVAGTLQWVKFDTSSITKEWTTRLNNRKLHYFNTYNSGGNSGGYANHKQIGLCSDGSFFYRGDFSASITVPGATGSSGNNQRNIGRWKVGSQGANAVLQLVFSDGAQASYVLSDNGGKTFLNGTRWLAENAPECN